MEYEKWIKMLNVLLLTRFGISVNDSFEDDQLRNFFNSGDSPTDIARDLKNKRELIELQPNLTRNTKERSTHVQHKKGF